MRSSDFQVLFGKHLSSVVATEDLIHQQQRSQNPNLPRRCPKPCPTCRIALLPWKMGSNIETSLEAHVPLCGFWCELQSFLWVREVGGNPPHGTLQAEGVRDRERSVGHPPFWQEANGLKRVSAKSQPAHLSIQQSNWVAFLGRKEISNKILSWLDGRRAFFPKGVQPLSVGCLWRGSLLCQAKHVSQLCIQGHPFVRWFSWEWDGRRILWASLVRKHMAARDKYAHGAGMKPLLQCKHGWSSFWHHEIRGQVFMRLNWAAARDKEPFLGGRMMRATLTMFHRHICPRVQIACHA